MKFAMYCSNWTEMNLPFKKLLLYAMRMNSAERLKLKFTDKGIVNFEIFMNVCVIYKFDK